MILLAFMLAVIQPKHSAQHDVAETRIYQRLALDHELMPPHASRKLRSDYWKAVACYAKFQAYQVSDCDQKLDCVEQELHIFEQRKR